MSVTRLAVGGKKGDQYFFAGPTCVAVFNGKDAKAAFFDFLKVTAGASALKKEGRP